MIKTSYLIVHEHCDTATAMSFYQAACEEAARLSLVYGNTARVYRLKIEHGRAELVEEAQYTNGE